MTVPHALEVQDVSYRYGDLLALDQLRFAVEAGELFALLGPNGSGKTTLFKLICTLGKLQDGDIRVFGDSCKSDTAAVRQSLGIIFQSPSLDGKLSVEENIRCQAALYGLSGTHLQKRLTEVASQLGISDRLDTRCEELSGGLKRRVEIAKGILHRPRLLLMDEPSTGLDPAARLDMWHALQQLCRDDGVTILLTTHLLEEAEKADRLGIMNRGQLVALGDSDGLRQELGGQVLTVHTGATDAVTNCLSEIQGSKQFEIQLLGDNIRINGEGVAELVAPLTKQLSDQINSINLAKPSLEDVFIARTGHQFFDNQQNSK